MSNTELLELAERVEAATADEQRLMLERAHTAIGFERHGIFTKDWPCGKAFARKLDAEAYESAAMMLKPDGCFVTMGVYPDGMAEASIGFCEDGPIAMAATPALALCAAALKARASQ